MENTDKVKRLRALSEARLRQEVLVPLLGRMGYRAVCEYHGTREYGKDIVCFDIDRLRHRRYLAVVAKTADLSGSVSSNRGLTEALNQAEQCFNTDYHDLFGMHSISMDAVWVVTSGRLIPGAAESVLGKLKKSNLNKLTRFIAGEQLVELIDEHFPSYWDLALESTENVRSQRDRYRAFLRELLKELGTAPDRMEEVLSALANSQWSPRISTNEFGSWAVSWASAYSIQIEKISDRYPKGIASRNCGDIQRSFRSARDGVRWALQDTEETLRKAEEVLNATDPREFVEGFEKNLRGDHPFGRAAYSREPSELGYLEDGLDDVDGYLARLKEAGRLDEVMSHVAAIESHGPAVTEFVAGVEVKEFHLAWEISGSSVLLHLGGSVPDGRLGFETHHTVDVQEHSRWGSGVRRVTAEDILESAQLELRATIEASLPPLAE